LKQKNNLPRIPPSRDRLARIKRITLINTKTKLELKE